MTNILGLAQAAIDRHAWFEAFELLSAHDQSEPLGAEGLKMLGDAALWTSQIDACIDALERAYAAYMKVEDTAGAGMVCLDLAEAHFHRLAESVANGWLNRAKRLLVEHSEATEYGWLARFQSVVAYEGRGDLEASLEHARMAYDIATRLGDYNLQALSLHDQGRVMLANGQVENGLSLMEEAMVRAVSEELDARVTGRIYCNMIDACERLADYKRAYEWDKAAHRWCERVGHASGFPGICRVKRANILRHHGAWGEAEAEARQACDELRDFLDFAGKGFGTIGEIRLKVGDLAGAEAALQRARELDQLAAEPGLALLRLANGDRSAAFQLITQALEGTRLPLHRAHLLPAQIEIALAAGHSDAAQQGVEELRRIAEKFQSDALSAAAAHGTGVFALHKGYAEDAIESLSQAAKLWNQVGLPYETARSRLGLGLAYRQRGAEELARFEMEAARSVFDRLGATPDAHHAEELLASETAATSTTGTAEAAGPSGRGTLEAPFDLLTPRELEILELIAQGESNADIAVHLSISRHTVRNHINRLFSKIGVRDRAQAIVAAHRAGIGTDA